MKRDKKVADWQETAESCKIVEVKFWTSAITVPQIFLVRNSAIDLVVRNIAELWRCGLKLWIPTFANKTFYP
jgi:hypothetical protein